MEIVIKSRTGKTTEEERDYLTRKLERLKRYLDGIGAVHVDLARTQPRGSAELHIAQVTLRADHGVVIRAEERDPAFVAAVDRLHDSLQRQLTRYKGRHYRRGKGARDVEPERLVGEADEPARSASNGAPQHVVKTKQFVYKPMDLDEAIEQMELLGHDFFVFTDATTNMVSVFYRRRDGQYGLIEQGAS